MLKNFKTFQLAVDFHRHCNGLRVAPYLRNQLLRAASSIVLNIAEGSAKPTAPEQRRFYAIAFGSLRECQAILYVTPKQDLFANNLADQLGACLYTLCYRKKAPA